MCSPLLPGITDTGKALDGMAKRAKAADASFFTAQPLFLKPCSKEVYLAFIREHFPALEPMYRQRFASDAFVSKAYRKRIEALVKGVCAKYDWTAQRRCSADREWETPRGVAGFKQWRTVVTELNPRIARLLLRVRSSSPRGPGPKRG